MRFRAGVAVAVLLGVLAASPSGADPLAPDPAVLSFAGSGATTATSTVTEVTSFDASEASVTAAGQYGGVLIRSASGMVVAGVLKLAALHWGVVPEQVHPKGPLSLGPSRVTLRPGVYRAYLLADAAAEVRIRLSAGPGRTVRTTQPGKRQRLHHQALDAGPAPAGQDVTVTTDYRFTRPADAYSAIFGQFLPGGYTDRVTLKLCVSRQPPQAECGGLSGTLKAASVARSSAMLVDTGLDNDRSSAGTWWQSVRLTHQLSTGGKLQLAYFQVDF